MSDFDRAAAELKAIDAAVRAALPAAAAAGAKPIAKEAKHRAPRGATMRLAESIVDEPVEQKLHMATHAVKVKQYYGYFLEYGFKPKGASQRYTYPFLRPAADSKKEEAEAEMAGVINAAVRRVTGG